MLHKMMDLQQLALTIKERPTSLFVGAGFSGDSGGPGGDKLLSEIKKYFSDDSKEKWFDYLEEKIGLDTDLRKEIEELIRNFLIKLEPNENQKYIFSIPWSSVITTNYDRIPENIEKTLDENREIKVIIDESEGVDITKEDKLYCFKLFGDVYKNYLEEGFMVLTNTDRRQVFSRLNYFYKLFHELCMSGNIIYLGYSFEDNIVFDLLSDLKYSVKEFPWKGYVIIRTPPTEDVKNKFKLYNIEWIEGSVDSFVKELKKVFNEIPISYPIEKKSLIMDNLRLDISRQTQVNCRNYIKYIYNELLEPISENPKIFFQGKDHTYYPFFKKWDLRRKLKIISKINRKLPYTQIDSPFYISQRIWGTSSLDNVKIALLGSAGSGKTIFAKRTAYEWYQKGNPVIFIDPKSYKIDKRAIQGFIEELNINYENRCKETGTKERSLRFLIIADNCSHHMEDIIDLFNDLSLEDILVDLFVVDRLSNIQLRTIEDYSFDMIYSIENTLNVEDLSNFISHFNRINLDIPNEIFINNLKNPDINKSFFALMYLTIKETQRPLKDIIIDEYNNLDKKYKYLYALISLLESKNIYLPLELLSKYCNISIIDLMNDINEGVLSGILKIVENKFVTTNHLIIAEIIDNHEFVTTQKYFDVVNDIIEKVTKGNEYEEDMMHDLLINKLTYPNIDVRIKRNKIIDLFERTIKKYKTGILCHHLAIHCLHNKSYEKGKKYIKEAKIVRSDKYRASERHLMDTDARLELLQSEQLMEQNEMDEAWEYLLKSERLFNLAISDAIASPHPIQGLAKCYYYMGYISEDYNTKFNYCLLGLSKLNYLTRNTDSKRSQYEEIEMNIIRELEPHFDILYARSLYDSHKNLDGYAYLSEIQIKRDNYEYANEIINEGMKYGVSLWLLRNKILVMKVLAPRDINNIGPYLEDYAKLGEFDFYLAFELGKYYFYESDFYRSFMIFNELSTKNEVYKTRLEYSTNNIYYEKGSMKEYRVVFKKIPSRINHGIILCRQLPNEFENIEVKFDDVKYSNPKERDLVFFNIYFDYSGPNALNVTKRD